MNQKEAETLSSPSEAFSTPANGSISKCCACEHAQKELISQGSGGSGRPGVGRISILHLTAFGDNLQHVQTLMSHRKKV